MKRLKRLKPPKQPRAPRRQKSSDPATQEPPRADREDTAPRMGFGRGLKIVSLAALAIVVLLAVMVVCLALFTGMCNIKKVNFTGNKILSAENLRQLSGIDNYKNLVTLPVGRIAGNLESNPWIVSAKVQRHLLNTVNVIIEERQGIAVLDYASTGFLVDAKGYVIARTPLEEFPELPRVHGGASVPPVVGESVKDRKVLECVKVLGSMSPEIRGTLALGNPFDGRGQVFISRLGYQVVYGPETDAKKKNEVLWAIITDVQSSHRRIAYIDVRVPDSPVVRPL